MRVSSNFNKVFLRNFMKSNLPNSADNKQLEINVPILQDYDNNCFNYSIDNKIKTTNLSRVLYENVDINDAVRMLNEGKINSDGSIDFKTSQERLTELREKGLSKYIDWNKFDKDISSITNYSSLNSNIKPKQIIDYLSSTYSSVKNQLSKDFSGNELNKQLGYLDKVMDKQIDCFAKTFSNTVGSIYEDNGLIDEKDKIYNSVKYIINEQVNQYDEFISNNYDYAEIKGTQDEWLSQYSDYMSSKLRTLYSSQVSSLNKSNDAEFYSKDELVLQTELAQKTDKIIRSEIVRNNESEEELGVRFGLMHLKAESYMDSLTVSQEHKQAMMNAVNNRIEKIVNDIDCLYESERKHPLLKEGIIGYSALNHNTIYEVMNAMTDSYKEDKNVNSAINKGITFGLNKYKSKEYFNNPIYRYKSSNFFDLMYSVDLKMTNVRYFKPSKDQICSDFTEFLNSCGIKTTDFFNKNIKV